MLKKLLYIICPACRGSGEPMDRIKVKEDKRVEKIIVKDDKKCPVCKGKGIKTSE